MAIQTAGIWPLDKINCRPGIKMSLCSSFGGNQLKFRISALSPVAPQTAEIQTFEKDHFPPRNKKRKFEICWLVNKQKVSGVRNRVPNQNLLGIPCHKTTWIH